MYFIFWYACTEMQESRVSGTLELQCCGSGPVSGSRLSVPITDAGSGTLFDSQLGMV